MKINLGSSFLIPAAVLALTLTLVPAAAPDVWDKKTNVQFGEPVEFPGGVVVPAGGYVMKLVDSTSNRNIVQVLNEDQNQVHATFHAIPTQRSRPAEETIITFYETPRGDPQFIHKWFYPGDTVGREFLYPKGRTRYIAQATTFSGPAADTDQEIEGATAAMTTEARAPEYMTGPSEEPEAVTAQAAVPAPEPQAEPIPSPAVGQQQGEAAAEAESKPEAGVQLPETASIVPQVALAGGLLILTALLLAMRRRLAVRSGTEPPERW